MRRAGVKVNIEGPSDWEEQEAIERLKGDEKRGLLVLHEAGEEGKAGSQGPLCVWGFVSF